MHREIHATGDECVRSGNPFTQMVYAFLLVVMLVLPVAAAGNPQDAGGVGAPPAGEQGAKPPPVTPPRLREPDVQQDTLTAADELAGRKVQVSFSENFVTDRLPFDVPFSVTGNVETQVRRLDLLVHRAESNTALTGLIAYLQDTPDCVGTRARTVVSKSSTTPGAAGQYSLLVSALEPQYYYAMCFVGVTPVPATEIESEARRSMAAATARTQNNEDVTRALVLTVRGVVNEQITRLGAGRRLPAAIPPGNLFHSETSAARIAPYVLRLSEAYGNLTGVDTAYEESRDSFAAALAKARAAGAPITTELLEAFPADDLLLPPAENAILIDKPFDRVTFTFDAGRRLLDDAIRAASPTDRTALGTLSKVFLEVRDAALLYGEYYEALRNVTHELITFVALESRQVHVTVGSSVLGADLVRSAYVGLDAGMAYAWRLENMVFYAGSNLYFRPINKAAPLRYAGSFLHRFALTVGITTTVKDPSRRADDLRSNPDDEDASNSLLLGAGFRITPSLRVGGGVLVFKEADPNPLIEQTSVTTTPYVSFTADVDVAGIFKSLF